MARYIDADAFIEKFKQALETAENYGLYNHAKINQYVIKAIEREPTADVAPRSEIEKLQEVIFKKEDLMQKIAEERNKYSDELEAAKDTNEHLAVLLAEAKTEVAREIFEEIEKAIEKKQIQPRDPFWNRGKIQSLCDYKTGCRTQKEIHEGKCMNYYVFQNGEVERNRRKAKMIEMRNNGFTYVEIGKEFGISRQRVCSIIGGKLKSHFKAITSDDCVYPKLRKWMNDNRITRAELCRRVIGNSHPQNQRRVSAFLKGKAPRVMKTTIDKYLMITGLTYEELFETEACTNCTHFVGCEPSTLGVCDQFERSGE